MRNKTFPASGFIFVARPYFDAFFGFDRTLGEIRRRAALDANSVDFGDVFGG